MSIILENIKELCADRGVTLRQLEKNCGLSPRYVYKWGTAIPGIDKVALVADYFGISIDELIGRSAPALSAADRQILNLFHELNEDGQIAALAMLQGLSRQPAYIKSHHDAEADLNAEA